MYYAKTKELIPINRNNIIPFQQSGNSSSSGSQRTVKTIYLYKNWRHRPETSIKTKKDGNHIEKCVLTEPVWTFTKIVRILYFLYPKNYSETKNSTGNE